EIVRAHDVAMGYPARESDLALEPLERGRVDGEDVGPNRLHRDHFAELTIERAIHDTVTADAQLLGDRVPPGEHASGHDGLGHAENAAVPRRRRCCLPLVHPTCDTG